MIGARRPTSCLAALLALAALLSPPCWATQPVNSPKESLSILLPSGTTHRFRVHLAVTADERARGLMYVRQMDEDVGMLFIYDAPRTISMWMKNTYIPLDMIFIDSRGRILNIATNTVPHSLASVSSEGPALAVLEINAGLASKLALEPGQQVLHRLLPSASKSSASETD